MATIERELARCVDFDFGLRRGVFPSLSGHFEYEKCGFQGMGYSIDTAFLVRFMNVFGVDELRDVNGKSCWVTHTHDSITMIEPLHKKDGKPFDIEAWQKWSSNNMPSHSASTLAGD